MTKYNAMRKGWVPLLFLLTIVAKPVVANELCARLIAQSWVDKKFTGAFLKSLTPTEPQVFEDRFKLPVEILAALPSRLDFNFDIYTTGAKVVVVYEFTSNNQVVGTFVLSLEERGSLRVATSEFLKVAPAFRNKGYGVNLMQNIPAFYKKLGVHYEKLEAGWEGRAYWPTMNFRFDTSSTFFEDGVELSQVELVRRNFIRFLDFHKIKREDLYVLRGTQRLPIDADYSQLREPIDFLNVKHSQGIKIMTQSYSDVDKLEPEGEMDVGLSFSLWDYRPRKGQEVEVFQGTKALSDIAMPTWIGIR